MKQVLTDCVLDRFREVAHADFLADQVIRALSGELNADDLPLQLRESIRTQSLQAWRTIWGNLVTKRCQEVLASRREQISQLINAHKQDWAAMSDSTGRR